MHLRLIILTISLGMTTNAMSEEKSDSDLAKKTQNPISDLISLPLQNNTNFNVGPSNGTQNILNIQPVYPVSLNEDWNLITRTIVPVVSQPSSLTGDSREWGLGDTTFTAWMSPKDSGSLIWGVGATALLPTGDEDVGGQDKWGLGPSVVLLTIKGPWVVGSLFSQVWSTGGGGNNDVSLFTWQYFVNYNMNQGWYLTSAPIITANWEQKSSETWTVPFGGGVGKIFRVGKMPLNGQVSAYYNVASPDLTGADWQLRLQLQLLFPK